MGTYSDTSLIDTPSHLRRNGTTDVRLPAPTVPEAVAGRVAAADVINGITVCLPDDAVLPSAGCVVVTLAGNGSTGSYTSLPLDITIREHTVPARYLAANFGSEVTVCYSVTAGPADVVSVPLVLNIDGFSQEDSHLPNVAILQATDAVLDVSNFDGDVRVEIAAWPLMAAGQRLWLWIEHNGASFASVVSTLTMSAPDVGSTHRFRVGRDRFSHLPDNALIYFIATIAFRPEVTSLVTHLRQAALTYRYASDPFLLPPTAVEATQRHA